jgi:voltage-gated potassium channel Kch
VRPAWRQARPFVVLALALTVVVLGTIGFGRVYPNDSVADSFYRALTLFGLGGAGSSVPWELGIARVLGPLITGYAAIQGLLALSREQVQLLWFRVFLRRHVVVAGLGDIGFTLARSFNDAGFQVVAIERDPSNPAIAGCRERGIAVVTADATDVAALRNARCERADLLVVTCGDDGGNMDVATAATRVALRRRFGVLTAVVHVNDMGLWRTLQAEEVASVRRAPIRLEFFNVFESAAYMLLDRFPPFPPSAPIGGPHTSVVVGFGGVAHSVVLHTARLWHNADKRPGAELRIALLGPSAEDDCRRLFIRHPELRSICEIRARTTALDVELERGELGLADGGARPVSSVYVCLDDEAEGLAAAMALRSRAETRAAPIVVTVADAGAGVASAVRDGAGILEDVDAFGVLSGALKPDLLLRGNSELLARAKHEEYLAQQRVAGTRPGPPAMVPWAQLPEDLKDANRRFADGIGAKLKAAGCALVPAPVTNSGGGDFSFSDAEVEELAKLEHDRWVRDKERDDWSYGPERNEADRVHPLMVPWEKLPEKEREKDRNPMRELPRILARVGLEIQRGPVQAAAEKQRGPEAITGAVRA